jgi:hypothetical protein
VRDQCGQFDLSDIASPHPVLKSPPPTFQTTDEKESRWTENNRAACKPAVQPQAADEANAHVEILRVMDLVRPSALRRSPSAKIRNWVQVQIGRKILSELWVGCFNSSLNVGN